MDQAPRMSMASNLHAVTIPSDRPHIIQWDLREGDWRYEQLRFRYGTHRVNYCQALLERHTAQSTSPNLLLHRRIDREIQALRDLCASPNIPQSCIQLEGFETFITYLAAVSSSDVPLFWQQLIDLRQLPKRLWIVLPSSLVPAQWPRDRLHCFERYPIPSSPVSSAATAPT
jgi:hypothetical protein